MNNQQHTSAYLMSLGNIERWFDKHFAWFFTNGMKAQHRATRQQKKALKEQYKRS